MWTSRYNKADLQLLNEWAWLLQNIVCFYRFKFNENFCQISRKMCVWSGLFATHIVTFNLPHSCNNIIKVYLVLIFSTLRVGASSNR